MSWAGCSSAFGPVFLIQVSSAGRFVVQAAVPCGPVARVLCSMGACAGRDAGPGAWCWRSWQDQAPGPDSVGLEV